MSEHLLVAAASSSALASSASSPASAAFLSSVSFHLMRCSISLRGTQQLYRCKLVANRLYMRMALAPPSATTRLAPFPMMAQPVSCICSAFLATLNLCATDDRLPMLQRCDWRR